MPYMVTFTINIPPMLAYIPYMDPMGYVNYDYLSLYQPPRSSQASSPRPRPMPSPWP